MPPLLLKGGQTVHRLVSNTSTHPYTDGKLLDMVTASSLGHKTCAVILVGRPNLGTSVRLATFQQYGL